jgi:hypothetical protein
MLLYFIGQSARSHLNDAYKLSWPNGFLIQAALDFKPGLHWIKNIPNGNP